MPSKRTSNAAKKTTGGARKGTAQKRGTGSSRTASARLTPMQGDILGVVLAVAAVAMLVSIVAPSSAVVTAAVHAALTLAFGVGAPLVPVALFLFAMTFFLGDERPVSGHVAGGLALIVAAVLAMLSLNVEGAAADPALVFDEGVATSAGGYVGGAVAWVLLTLVGTVVGNVVLVGVVLAGLVVCGFSISGAVARVRERASEAWARHRERAEERREQAIIDAVAAEEQSAQREDAQGGAADAGASGGGASQPSLFDETGEATTSYIGARKTSVLKRRQAQAGDTPPTQKAPAPTVELPWDEGAPAGGADAAASTASAAPASHLRDVPEGATVVLVGEDRPLDPAVIDPAALDQTLVSPAPEPAPGPAEGSQAGSADGAGAKAGEGAGTVPGFLRGTRRRKGAAAATTAAEAGAAAADAAAVTGDAPAPSDPADAAPAGEAVRIAPAPRAARPGDGDASYELPPLSILRVNADSASSFASESELAATAARLQATLEEFNSTSRVTGWVAGPSVTTFKVSMGEGERVSKIVNLQDDIALSLAARSVRIFAPIPGTSLVGVEIPNEKAQPVYLADVLPYATGGPLECAFGRDSEGRPIVVDLAGLPHLLVAGTTGSGKSVLLNSIIMSMLMRATPEQVRLIMVDPKRVEFTSYAGLPHLYVPVVTEPRQAASALQWGVTEMERRLKVFEHYKVRDIATYNRNVDGDKYAQMDNPPAHMPYFVIVIDELADLMMVAGKDVESSIVRIAQLGRAAGIHLVVATQRPSADVVTGLIRANIDNRVALSVDNSLNSRIILDQKGAEQLLGRGDMLVKLRGKKPRRAQGCMVSDEEIEAAVAHIKGQVSADYHEDILTAVVPTTPGGAGPEAPKDEDPLLWEAAGIVVDSQLGSTSGLQRALSVGYARAGRIMDMLEAKGVVGPANGSKPREVLLDKDGLEDLKAAEAAYREVV